MPKMLPGGSGNSWLVLAAMSAPVFLLTEEAQLPSSSKLKNPPGHRPSFPLSTFITVSPRPVLPRTVQSTVNDTLPDLRDVYIEGNAFFSELVADAPPVAGERRA